MNQIEYACGCKYRTDEPNQYHDHLCACCKVWAHQHAREVEENAAYVDVSYITEYGLTQKLSNAVRVF